MAEVIPKNLMGMLHFFLVLWHSIEIPSTRERPLKRNNFFFSIKNNFFGGYYMVSLLNKLVIVLHGAMTHVDFGRSEFGDKGEKEPKCFITLILYGQYMFVLQRG